jgi:hypothetical protein
MWIARGGICADNHVYKIKRIKRLARIYGCQSFIETGTFVGQTVSAVQRHFQRVLSVELSESLYQQNRRSFLVKPNVTILHGDSETLLGGMIDQATGRILFWLDGHFSGGITAQGKLITPIMNELMIIQSKSRKDDCILIDDVRLFNGEEGYPKLAVVKNALYDICPEYDIDIDHDCLVAKPR